MEVLSVVLPIRCSADKDYLVQRLDSSLASFGRYDDVECVVVDSASPAPYAAAIRRACERDRCVWVTDPEPQQPFAPGSVRNAGAERASGEHILFFDVDLWCDDDFVGHVMRWAEEAQAPEAFLPIPCLFLTEAGTQRRRPLDEYLRSALAGENDWVQHVGHSAVVVHREHFLKLGGYRAEYRGHGCEDFDLLHRLVSFHPMGKRAADYYTDHKTRFPGDYRGFRAYFAYYSLPHLFDGPYTAHQWHPRPLTRPYYRRRLENEQLLQQAMRAHDADDGVWSAERPPELPPIAEVIADLQSKHGFPVDAYPGLFRWRDGVELPPHTARSKLRKLYLQPAAFFRDSRNPLVRGLRHLFGAEKRS